MVCKERITGTIFTDGSGIKNKHWKKLDRAGWGYAVMNGDVFVGGKYGPVQGQLQTVPRSELIAILKVLEDCTLPVAIHTDHKNHVQSYKRGKGYCLRWNAPHLDIWLKIWQEIDRLDPQEGELTLKWVKAHTSARRDESDDERAKRIGNAKADSLAGSGRAMHDVPNGICKQVERDHKLEWKTRYG